MIEKRYVIEYVTPQVEQPSISGSASKSSLALVFILLFIMGSGVFSYFYGVDRIGQKLSGVIDHIFDNPTNYYSERIANHIAQNKNDIEEASSVSSEPQEIGEDFNTAMNEINPQHEHATAETDNQLSETTSEVVQITDALKDGNKQVIQEEPETPIEKNQIVPSVDEIKEHTMANKEKFIESKRNGEESKKIAVDETLIAAAPVPANTEKKNTVALATETSQSDSSEEPTTIEAKTKISEAINQEMASNIDEITKQLEQTKKQNQNLEQALAAQQDNNKKLEQLLEDARKTATQKDKEYFSALERLNRQSTLEEQVAANDDADITSITNKVRLADLKKVEPIKEAETATTTKSPTELSATTSVDAIIAAMKTVEKTKEDNKADPQELIQVKVNQIFNSVRGTSLTSN